MKNHNAISLLILLLVLLISCMDGNTYKEGILKNNYELVWSDFFLDQDLDSTKWNIEIRDPGWVNNELQAYTDRQRNIHINNSNLVLKSIKENHNNARYTSGRINTQGKANWKYGRFEIRAKVPMQKGVWPAIWLLNENIVNEGWPKCGEIDIMEHINNENIIYGTIHSEEYNHMTKTQIGGEVVINDLDSNFHTFGLEWNSESLIWFIDENVYHRVDKKDYFKDKWPFDSSYFLIINQAIGGFWPGDPNNDFKTAEYIIDWIKIYQ